VFFKACKKPQQLFCGSDLLIFVLSFRGILFSGFSALTFEARVFIGEIPPRYGSSRNKACRAEYYANVT
jgi:hypothetical protein